MANNLPALTECGVVYGYRADAFFLPQKKASRHKPLISWCAWCLMLLYAITPLSYLCGHPLPADWLVVVLNLVFGVLGGVRAVMFQKFLPY